MNPNSRLFKYEIGLAVIGVFTFVMLVVVLIQAGAARHDNDLYKAADKIATKLNDYNDRHDKVPAVLETAGIDDVPEDISYTKLSKSRYKFCMTYKNDSRGPGPIQAFERYYYGEGYDNPYYNDSDESDYLYISATYKKGENCETVNINLYNDYDDSSDSQVQGI